MVYLVMNLVACAKYVNPSPTTIAVPQGMIYKTRDCFDLLKNSGGEVLCDKWWVMNKNEQVMVLNQENENDPSEPILSHKYSMAAYSYMGDLWIIDLSNREKRNITNTPHYYETSPMWSPNDKSIAYIGSIGDGIGDLWILNLSTGEKQNLSNTPNRDEFCWARHYYCSIIWLAENVVFPSQERTEQNTPSKVLLTKINLRNLEYTILDNENETGEPSLSPDSQKIAYGTGQIYDLQSQQLTIISSVDYGLTFLPMRT